MRAVPGVQDGDRAGALRRGGVLHDGQELQLAALLHGVADADRHYVIHIVAATAPDVGVDDKPDGGRSRRAQHGGQGRGHDAEAMLRHCVHACCTDRRRPVTTTALSAVTASHGSRHTVSGTAPHVYERRSRTGTVSRKPVASETSVRSSNVAVFKAHGRAGGHAAAAGPSAKQSDQGRPGIRSQSLCHLKQN